MWIEMLRCTVERQHVCVVRPNFCQNSGQDLVDFCEGHFVNPPCLPFDQIHSIRSCMEEIFEISLVESTSGATNDKLRQLRVQLVIVRDESNVGEIEAALVSTSVETSVTSVSLTPPVFHNYAFERSRDDRD